MGTLDRDSSDVVALVENLYNVSLYRIYFDAQINYFDKIALEKSYEYLILDYPLHSLPPPQPQLHF